MGAAVTVEIRFTSELFGMLRKALPILFLDTKVLVRVPICIVICLQLLEFNLQTAW